MSKEEAQKIMAEIPAELIAEIIKPRLALYYQGAYEYELPHAAMMLALDLQGKP